MATPTPSCEVCDAVASGGRIRVTEASSELLIGLLRDYRKERVLDRRSAITNESPKDVGETNEQLRVADILIKEIERTQAEKQWPTSAT